MTELSVPVEKVVISPGKCNRRTGADCADRWERMAKKIQDAAESVSGVESACHWNSAENVRTQLENSLHFRNCSRTRCSQAR